MHTEAQSRTYDAMMTAAQRIASNCYRHKINVIRMKRLDGKKSDSYVVTDPHMRQLIDCAPLVLSGKMSPEEGMSLVSDHTAFRKRFATTAAELSAM